MKLLLDHGLPRSTIGHLAKFGFSAEHVGDLGLAAAADSELLDEARSRAAIIVTFDADFHRLMAAAQATAPSVIRIRVEGLKGDQLAALIVQVIAVANADLVAGAMVSATAQQIRIRRLPITTR